SLFPPAVARMALDGLIIERGSELALPGHQANPSPDQQVAIAALISELEAAPFAPPPLPDLAGRYQLTPALLQYLTATGRLVPLAAHVSPPPAPGPLLANTSHHMVLLKGFHFQMQIQGFTGSTVPVESANGDAHPPDLHSSVQLRQGGVLVQLEIIFSADQVYLKSFTGGWQRLTAAEVVQFFDPHSLFDQQDGLFAALKDTQSP